MFNMSLAFTVLLTGIITVFIVLIILTFTIKGYGNITNYVYRNRNNSPKDLNRKNNSDKKLVFIEEQENTDQIQDEIVAAISAAVAYIYSNTKTDYYIKSITPLANTRSSWRMQGLFENTHPF